MLSLIPFLIVGLVMKQVYDDNFSNANDISEEKQIVVEKTIEAKPEEEVKLEPVPQKEPEPQPEPEKEPEPKPEPEKEAEPKPEPTPQPEEPKEQVNSSTNQQIVFIILFGVVGCGFKI